ncbi:WXG100 family type VII secretion target [Nocardia macrotermitis]|uniref:WXG100 family type VII secretion target n=1 Tax=Nocardia macrotermitis TaxID=2585198 RepID=A0A7K0DC68_9NOCA|nr:WXG100 family type VII secretion target [Nocardia macrotermitis]MQY23131.1 hypothetical protein [Nocardia macrotermitis]
MGKVQVDPELLRQAAEKTRHVSDRISNALTTLQSQADGLGSPWGEDVYGYKFAVENGYLDAQTQLHTITDGLAGHSSSHADGQQTSSKYLTDTDDGNSDGFK